MKLKKFVVTFSNGTYPAADVYISAFNAAEAIILAQSDRISGGLDYTVVNVKHEK